MQNFNSFIWQFAYIDFFPPSLSLGFSLKANILQFFQFLLQQKTILVINSKGKVIWDWLSVLCIKMKFQLLNTRVT